MLPLKKGFLQLYHEPTRVWSVIFYIIKGRERWQGAKSKASYDKNIFQRMM